MSNIPTSLKVASKFMTACNSCISTGSAGLQMSFGFHHVVVVIVILITGCDGGAGPDLGFGNERVFEDHLEVDVRYLSSDGVVLAGTLFLPVGVGPFPAVVLQSGSGPWTRPLYTERSGIPGWNRIGFAVLGYDKRGAGESGGECCPWRDPGYYYQLAEDVQAGLHTIAARSDVDEDFIGLFGASEGGWVVPIAASGEDVAFTMIFSGPAVTLREELLYSYYTGDDLGCEPTGRSEAEIWSGISRGELPADIFPFLNGPGFNPLPFLEELDVPGIWLYGGNDTSVPVQRSIANLEEIRERFNRDWTFIVYPDANHSLIVDGIMCQVEGPVVDLSVTFEWLVPRLAEFIDYRTYR